jgi:uncharacterized circularly permuted ATP-grasp superfamily protein/uncharacterized alpha-E superfamily protein
VNAASDRLSGYATRSDGFDEAFDAEGRPRESWRAVLDAFGALPADDTERRRRQAEALLRQNGMVLNIYDQPEGAEQAWPFDLVPMVLGETEWRKLEQGIAQRARLLDALLADLYGERRLLRDDLLPAALALGHPGLVELCRGLPVAGGRRLVLYAADLLRGPDGTWRVLGDSAQAPSGSGYALENRVVLSRSLPEAMRSAQVRRLAPYFAALRENLRRLAPWSDNPRVVVLTPGPYNESYAEHAYLSRYLGFTLVEGGDLIVKERRVWLKTLGGLEPVDVILRRLDDVYADPLELRLDSTIGVPGLVEALRGGRLALANALGAGAIEMPALFAYLPALARAIAGEELILPSVEGFWLGEKGGLERLRAEAKDLVLLPAQAAARVGTVLSEISEDARRETLDRVAAAPGRFAALRALRPSSVPAIVDGRFAPQAATLRVFASAAPDGEYHVMPGGLVRVAGDARGFDLSLQRGARSKDLWVLSSSPVEPFTLLTTSDGTLGIREASSDLPSRIADNLFWLGRYAERVEGEIRGLRSALARLADGASPADLAPLGRYLRRQGLIDHDGTAALAPFERGLIRAVADPARNVGLIADLGRLARVTRPVEDRLSSDMTRVLRQLRALGDATAGGPLPTLADALGLLDRFVTIMAAFNGMEMENMTRGHGWRFLDLGRRIERALGGAAAIEATLAHADGAALAALDIALELADSAMTYRSRYFAAPQFAPTLHLLLIDESNPRSIAYQAAAVARHVEALPRERPNGRPAAERGLSQQAAKLLKGADLAPLGKPGPDGQRPELRKLLDDIEALLRGVSDAVGAHFFGHGNALSSFAVPSEPPR